MNSGRIFTDMQSMEVNILRATVHRVREAGLCQTQSSTDSPTGYIFRCRRGASLAPTHTSNHTPWRIFKSHDIKAKILSCANERQF